MKIKSNLARFFLLLGMIFVRVAIKLHPDAALLFEEGLMQGIDALEDSG